MQLTSNYDASGNCIGLNGSNGKITSGTRRNIGEVMFKEYDITQEFYIINVILVTNQLELVIVGISYKTPLHMNSVTGCFHIGGKCIQRCCWMRRNKQNIINEVW